MPLPNSGEIGLLMIRDFFQKEGEISLSDLYRGGGLVPDIPENSKIPTSGAIGLKDFYGAYRLSLMSVSKTTSTIKSAPASETRTRNTDVDLSQSTTKSTSKSTSYTTSWTYSRSTIITPGKADTRNTTVGTSKTTSKNTSWNYTATTSWVGSQSTSYVYNFTTTWTSSWVTTWDTLVAA